MPRSRLDQGIPIDPLDSSQEPYVHIVAPNIDHISRDTFRAGSVERRRVLRGLAVFAIAIGILVVFGVVGALLVALQSR
jgi:hypothetical protein